MRKTHVLILGSLIVLCLVSILLIPVSWAVPLKLKGTVPLPPQAVYPIDGEPVFNNTPTLMWAPPLQGGRVVLYQIHVNASPRFNDFMRSDSWYVPGSARSFTIPDEDRMPGYEYMVDDETLYWRIRAQFSDGKWSLWGGGSFYMNLHLLPAPRLIRPEHRAALSELRPTFEWEAIPAPIYHIQVSEDRDFAETPAFSSVTSSTSISPSRDLREHTTYYWRVRGGRSGDIWGSFCEAREFRITTVLPPARLLAPEDGSTVGSLTPELSWEHIEGREGSGYQIQISTNRGFSPASDYTVYRNHIVIPSGHLRDETTYYWRVKVRRTEWRAIDPIWSFTVSVIPAMTAITTGELSRGLRLVNSLRRAPPFVGNAGAAVRAFRPVDSRPVEHQAVVLGYLLVHPYRPFGTALDA